MKKLFTSLRVSVMLMLMFVSLGGFAVTFNVTVPTGTNECYIAGSFNSWAPQKMNRLTATTYQLDVPSVTSTTGLKYKYCSGPSFEYVEKSATGAEISDRNYNANDQVARWLAVYDPALTPGTITITATVPSGTPDNQVYIAGSFQTPDAWEPANAVKMTKLSATQYRVEIPNVTAIAYKLLCGHSWENEEVNSDQSAITDRTASVANPNVSITVQRWKSTTPPAANDFVTHTFSSFAPLSGSRRIIIYLPPDYATNTEKHYPVLYMHDGQNIFESGAFGSWRVQDAMQALYSAGKKVGIIVGIDNSAGRMSEYAPFPNAQNAPNPQGDAYLQAIVNNVIPYINANYRTLPDRENTGIAGSSLGGLISYYAGLKLDNVFGRIGAMSPSFWYCKTDLNNYLTLWSGTNKDKTKIYFICGNNEGSSTMVPDMQQFYNSTVSKGFATDNLKYEVVAGGGHNEASWAAQIGRVYEFLFEKNEVPTSLNDKSAEKSFEIISNPNSIEIINKSDSKISFSLYSISGQKKLNTSISNSYSLPALEKGVYIGQIKLNDKVYTQKISVK